MAFKMKNTGGTYKTMGSSPAKMASPTKATGDPKKPGDISNMAPGDRNRSNESFATENLLENLNLYAKDKKAFVDKAERRNEEYAEGKKAGSQGSSSGVTVAQKATLEGVKGYRPGDEGYDKTNSTESVVAENAMYDSGIKGNQKGAKSRKAQAGVNTLARNAQGQALTKAGYNKMSDRQRRKFKAANPDLFKNYKKMSAGKK